MGGGMRGRRLAALKSANESREPKFVIAARELVRAAPSLRPQYSRNPLCAPCDGAEFSESVGARWAADARALCDWDAMPPALDVAHPEGGAVPADRGARKRQQLLNVALFVAPALRLNPRAKVVDFGAGGGHQSLFLARAFPDATFCLVDLKRRSLEVASRRVQQAGLKNVRIVHGRIEDFREDFDVGVALHACGGASDAALLRCVEKKATFVVAPCCVGKIADFAKRAETTTTTANACDTACDPKTDDDADDDDDAFENLFEEEGRLFSFDSDADVDGDVVANETSSSGRARVSVGETAGDDLRTNSTNDPIGGLVAGSWPTTQRLLLARGAALCRPDGGALIYATCSMLEAENQDVARWFERRFGGGGGGEDAPLPETTGSERGGVFGSFAFAPDPFPPGWPSPIGPEGARGGDASHEAALNPVDHGTDGFYVARWRRRPRGAPRGGAG